MRKVRDIIISIACAFLAFSCEKGVEPALVDITGEWRLQTLNGVPADDVFEDENLDVFVSFSSDGNFETYQRLSGGTRFVRYYGTWTVSGTTADGTYSDGTRWNTYEVSLLDGGETLVMTSGLEECVYYRTEIPESVLENSIDYVSMKSSSLTVPGKFL